MVNRFLLQVGQVQCKRLRTLLTIDDSIEVDNSKGHVMQVLQSQLNQVGACLQLYLSSGVWQKTKFSGLNYQSVVWAYSLICYFPG